MMHIDWMGRYGGRALMCLAALLAASLACSLPGRGNEGETGAATRSAAETEAAAATQAGTPGGLGAGDLTPGAGEATLPASEATEPAAEATGVPTAATSVPTTEPAAGSGEGGGGAGAYAAQTACDHPYLPLRQGAQWTYRTDEGDYTWTVTEVTGDTSSATATLLVEAGETTLTYHWECDSRGLVSYDFGNVAIANEGGSIDYEVEGASGVWLPPASEMAPGAGWQRDYTLNYAITLGSDALDASADVSEDFSVGGEETVTVPAGEFDALVMQIAAAYEITVDIPNTQPTEMSGTFTYWLAYGVGVVRQHSSIFAVEGTTELVSYTVP